MPTPTNMYKFFRFEVRDVSARDGWADGSKFEARVEDHRVTVDRLDNGVTYQAVLRAGSQALVTADGSDPAHALQLLESKVRMLQATLESITAQ